MFALQIVVDHVQWIVKLKRGTMSDFQQELDARGLNCPLPILRTKKAINSLTSGQILKVIATDPGSVRDMEAFCKQTGNTLISTSETNGEYTFMIQKA